MASQHIELPVRYYRHYVDLDKPNDEAHLEFAHATFPLDLRETALVLVDCWNDHHNAGWIKRAARVMHEKIAPVLQAVRLTPATIVHAPSPAVAPVYPQWVRYADDVDLGLRAEAPGGPEVGWPPAEFRGRTGDYAVYAQRSEPRAASPWSAIDPSVAPADDEFVIATGRQLHRLLAHRRILHLIYAGFAANMCILNRDYGLRAMSRYGYNLLLMRDCTCAVESHDTLADESLLKATVRDIEMQLGWTAASADLLRALGDAARNGSGATT